MKLFLSFVQKEFFHIFRDVRTMLILLVMPIILVLLFGFAISTEVRNVKVAIYDPSKDAVTNQLIKKVDGNSYFTVTQYLSSASQIKDYIRSADINLILVFSDDFAEHLKSDGKATVQLLADGTNPNQATMIIGYAQNILMDYMREQSAANSRLKGFRINTNTRMLFNPQQRSEFNFVPGIIGMIVLLICAMMSSIAIVREKELGTIEVLLASPLPPAYIVLAKAVPYFLISCINLACILLLSIFLIGIPIAGSLLAIIGISLLYILVALSLGLLISSIVESQLAAMLTSGMVLMMPTMLLSGMIFPIESMPLWLQCISTIVPARWFIDAIRRLMIQGADLQFVAHDVAILVAMLATFLTVAIKKFKIRLE